MAPNVVYAVFGSGVLDRARMTAMVYSTQHMILVPCRAIKLQSVASSLCTRSKPYSSLAPDPRVAYHKAHNASPHH
jgi:hypothetical protein